MRFFRRTGQTILIPIVTGVIIMALLGCAYLLPTERMKEHLQAAMEATGKTKFKTKLFSFGIQKNGGKAPLILDTEDYEHLPEGMRKITYEPDNTAIREYLEAGNTLEWAHIGERGYSLRIK